MADIVGHSQSSAGPAPQPLDDLGQGPPILLPDGDTAQAVPQLPALPETHGVPATAGASEPVMRPGSARKQDLLDLVDRTVSRAEERREWYNSRAGLMGTISRRLRFWAVILGLAGGVCPLVPNTLIVEAVGIPGSAVSALGFILIALAGGLMVLDQVFGYSSSWMRFRLSELRLAKLIGDLQNEVGGDLVVVPDGLVPPDRTEKILKGLTQFSGAVDETLIVETETWISEFKAGLLQVDRLTKSGSAAAPGVATAR